MDIQLIKALQHLAEFKTLTPDLSSDRFVDGIVIVEDSLPKLSAADRKLVMSAILTVLTNSNAGAVFVQEIPNNIYRLIVEEKLLSIADITSVLANLSEYFIANADKWIGELHYYNYILYAVRQDYPISEISDGLSSISLSEVMCFLQILEKIHDPDDSWQEGNAKVHELIKLIRNQIIPNWA